MIGKVKLKEIIKEHNIHPKKRLGQNFIFDFNILNKIVKNRLINGYDDIELTLKNEKLIKEYESNKNKFFHLTSSVTSTK